MFTRAGIVAAGLALAGTAAQASSFAVFPVKEIEGLGARAPAGSRPLIDAGVAQRYLGAEVQRAVLAHFVAELARVFPQSLVHAKQIGPVRRGSHVFTDNDSQACGESPYTAALTDSYAAVLGITRASEYRVQRGNALEALIPLTLSVQLVKPDKGKPVLALSDTVVTPVRATRADFDSPAVQARVRDALTAGLRTQVTALVETLRKDFNPQPTDVTVLGRDGDLLVVDRGAEAGFKTGDEPEAVRAGQAAGPTLLFRVLSAQQGVSVLKPLQGRADKGDVLTFTLATAADNGLKPRLMPVTSPDPIRVDEVAIATLFAREVGFKAPFQIAPVDVNFADSMASIKAQANCVGDWSSYPGATQIKGSRKDAPSFFLRVARERTPVHSSSGTGGTLGRDQFSTLVMAQVVDRHGRVLHSDMAVDDYAIDRVNGAGLSLQAGFEISMKNATVKLAESFVKATRLVPKEFPVQRSSKNEVWVDGLGAADGDRLVFTVLRPLSVKVGGQPVMLPLELGEGATGARRDGAASVLSFSVTSHELPPPRQGDVLRVESMPRVGAERVSRCALPPHVGERTLMAMPFAARMASYAVYRSKRYGVVLADDAFFADARRLLDAGNYAAELGTPAAAEVCFQPGYVVRQDSGSCDGDQCRAELLNGVAVRLWQGSSVSRELFSVQRTHLVNFSAPQRDSLVGYRAMGLLAGPMADLQKKVDAIN